MAEETGNQRLEQKTIKGQVITHTIVKPLRAEPSAPAAEPEAEAEES
ncbi:hypothetical protein ACFV9E_32820 [Streptomyces sp. NPDC059835]